MLIDIDHFKRINDTFGHDVGDDVLKAIATLLRTQTRASDVTCRMGGEELLVVLPNASLEQATAKAETLRQRIAALELRARERPIGTVTASFGVALFPRHAERADELLKKADHALYAAKHAGRNQVLAAEYGPKGIRVNALLPGGTDTPSATFKTPEARSFVEGLHALKRVAQPEEIARSALYLASDASSFTTGAALFADGGVSINRT